MILQKSSIPPATRMRENQRRFRARQKELVEELQQQLQEYKQNEIQANTIIQLAARKVAWENAQLRELLATKGVSSASIEAFLASKQQTKSITAARGFQSSAVVHTSPSHITQSQRCASKQRNDHGLTRDEERKILVISSPEPSACSNSTSLLPIQPTQSMRSTAIKVHPTLQENPRYSDDGCCTASLPSQLENDAGLESPNLLPPVSDCYCPAVPIQNLTSADDSMLEMSCETAASIISGMRGTGDEERVRAELGCFGNENCNVKNSKVLQVLGMD